MSGSDQDPSHSTAEAEGGAYAPTTDRRVFPRLKAAYCVRFGVCGQHGAQVPGFTNDLSLSGVSIMCPDASAKVGDHVAVEVTVPGFEAPLYFLGQIVRAQLVQGGTELACRFDWLGKSDRYQEKLAALLTEHSEVLE